MSTPSLHEIRTAIVAAVGAPLTVGVAPSTYTVDLTGRVGRGRYTIPPRLPFAALAGLVGRTRPADVFGSWATTIVLDLIVWAPARTVGMDTRVVEAEDLLSAVQAALHVAQTTVGNALRSVPDLAADLVAIDSDFEGAGEGCVQAAIAISCTLVRSTPGLL